MLSVRLVKSSPGRSLAPPRLEFLSNVWRVAEKPHHNGENDWEIYFEIETDSDPLRLEEIVMIAPGVKAHRMLVGKTDVSFEQDGDRVRFRLMDDRSRGRVMQAVYRDPRGGYLIGFMHNWEMRRSWQYLEDPYPRRQLDSIPNYLLAAHEVLRIMGDLGPESPKPFDGDIVISGSEIAATRRHNDYPPHVHIMFYQFEKDAAGKQEWVRRLAPHFYIDENGKIVRNKYDVLVGPGQSGNLEAGDLCRFEDASGRHVLDLIITNKGLVLRRPDGEEYSLRPHPDRGADHAVYGFRGEEPVCRAEAHDDPENGLFWFEIQSLQDGKVTATFRDGYRYDPFTAKVLEKVYPKTLAAQRLKVSENRRFLVYEDGRPFFYLGDTGWELFHRLNREEADRYLQDRARKGFTVIQAVALSTSAVRMATRESPVDANAYGHLPFIENDPAKPDVKDGPANDYWDHVDYIVNKAESLGLFIGFLPSWGDKWNNRTGRAGPEIFTSQNSATYGEWLGRRYKAKPIIWILGGDRPIDNSRHEEIIRAMALGLRKGDGGSQLITFHPPGGRGSAEWFHDEGWLDFNMRQNAHVPEFTGRYDKTLEDYNRAPVKPVIDGEPLYEDHPIAFKPKELGHSIAADARRPLYWNLFNGAFGHTYGHHSVWQMWAPGRNPVNDPLMPWYEALDQPGARQMQYGRWLIESRPFLTRIPDDSVIVTDHVPTSVPGAGRYRFVATRDIEGTYAMVYAPIGRAFKVRMDAIGGPNVKAWWFNPRNGEAQEVGVFPNTGQREFVPPDVGEILDWVLVLDDASKNYPQPGKRK